MTSPSPGVTWPPAGRRLLVLAGLCGFAISQPVLSVLGEEPTILVRYGLEGRTLILFAVLVAFVPPLLLWGATQAIAVVSPSVARAAHLLLVAALAMLFVVQLAKAIGLDGRIGLTIVSLAVGVAFVTLYVRFQLVADWARYTAVLPLLAAGFFVLASPASALLEPRSAPPERLAGTEDEPSVVFIILDELPTRSLLDATGGIDRVRYPSLAALADDSTWYRRHTALASYTTVAVPSLLTGRNPEIKEALWTSYPDNLFTLLAPTHDLDVLETATSLCPYSTCAPTTTDASGSSLGIGDLLAVAADVWRERVSIGPDRPPTLDDFAEEAIADSATTSGLVSDDRRLADPEAQLRVSSERLDTFVSSLEAAEGPTFSYLHLMLPHQPWLRRADGLPYSVDKPFGLDLPGEDVTYLFSWDPWNAALSEQRHLLQTQYADREVGRVLDALEAAGRYDDSLVIVTSDHGVSFEERTEARFVEPTTIDAIAYSPLLIKLPGQAEPVVDDTNVMAIDVVPTVAEQLGIKLPWPVDGAPAGSPAIAARGDTKVLWDLEGVYELALAGILEFSDRETFATVGDRWIGPIAPGEDDLAGLDRVLPLGGIIGEPLAVTALPIGRVRIDSLDLLRRPPRGVARLGVVTGHVQEPALDGTFVLAVNGRVVAGSALSEDSSGRTGLVTLLLPAGVLEAENEIRAALVTDAGLVELELVR